jgi:hypothetical protein
MKHVDYEKTMIMQAARGGYGRPLRDDAHCLICRWWRKPCPACQAAQNGRPGKRPGAPTDLDALLRQEFNRLRRDGRHDRHELQKTGPRFESNLRKLTKSASEAVVEQD